jgi:hypothetical protein
VILSDSTSNPVPALGLAWSHCVNTRIILRRSTRDICSTSYSEIPTEITISSDSSSYNNNDNKSEIISKSINNHVSKRSLSLEFSPLSPPNTCDFEIVNEGIL